MFVKTDTLTTETDTDDEEFTEEEKLDALRQVAEEEQNQTGIRPVEQSKGNPIYQKYIAYQSEHPTSIVAYRLGDFYEVLGDNAVMLGNEMELTITSRDVGLKERVPMIGFPYHAAENYFAKIVRKHDLYIIENEHETAIISCSIFLNTNTAQLTDIRAYTFSNIYGFTNSIRKSNYIKAEKGKSAVISSL